ncbi:hypothetical protein QQF64_034212 [Cirrhinus molitorella]|uniref:Uncharacterized protein n=1 Tax=Cirrhinus molitorella TaxID=172907 RepID=A0ABR3MW34_9TELE
MEEKEIICRSTSEYASPLVLVWKKNGDHRVCTDFHWLNTRTIKDAHALPHHYNFDTKYVPGPQNVIADSLSRVPFVKSGVTQRLLQVPYDTVLTDMRGMSSDSVQVAFRWSCNKNQ